MRETPAAFAARTGRRYDPSLVQRALGKPITGDEACPTLFRYPGACGVSDSFAGAMTRLGPAHQEVVWLTAAPGHSDGAGARFFGSIAVLRPLDLHPVRVDGVFDPRDAAGAAVAVWAGDNLMLEDPEAVVWIPPSALQVRLPWDEFSRAGDAIAAFGVGYSDERARAAEAVSTYLEELSMLRATGTPGPAVPWCEVPADRRRDTLARLGLSPRWSRAA